jgi:hypothetical protein
VGELGLGGERKKENLRYDGGSACCHDDPRGISPGLGFAEYLSDSFGKNVVLIYPAWTHTVHGF